MQPRKGGHAPAQRKKRLTIFITGGLERGRDN
nr:MAG TPA: hypothetical protein [Caudoviricetes sp.]